MPVIKYIAEKLFGPIFDAVYRSLDYQGVAIVAGLTVGLLLAYVVRQLAKIWAPTPDRQITLTWEYIGEKAYKKKKTQSERAIQAEHERESRFLDKQKFIETSYRRLGKTLTYDDFKKVAGTYKLMGVLLGAVIMVVGVATNMIILLIPGLILAAGGLFFGESLLYNFLNANINALNLREKIELPILITRFMAIAQQWKQYPLNSVLTTYLPYADAMKYDIELVLADIKSFGDLAALDLWQTRVTLHRTTEMMEFTQFIEKLKKLYSKGDEIYVRTELSMLSRTIDEKYVAEKINKITKKRTLQLIIIMLGSFAVVGGFFIVPKVLEILDALQNAF